MKCDPEASLVIAALEAALASGKLALTMEATARRLMSRLSSPVRVVILGLPGSGKSQLLNMLAGQPIIPAGARLPTIALSYAAAPRTHAHLPGGRIETRDGLVLEDLGATRPARIEVEAPLSILERISLTEIAGDASVEGQRAAISEAVNCADMLLWCSQDFSGAEPLLWNQVPEPLKDHAFLVLTKADQLHRDGNLGQRMADLEEVVADEFHSLFPVAAQQAAAAMATAGPTPKEFTASGAAALVSAIHRHVDQGRHADVDNARLFLRRHGFSEQAGRAEAPPPRPAPEPPAPEPPAPAPAAAAPSAPLASGPPPEPESLRARLLARLDAGAAGLDEVAGAPSPEDIADLFEACTETVDGLAAMLEEADPRNPALSDLQQDIEEVAEMILLMQIEATAGAAADAVTLLLQLRREIDI